MPHASVPSERGYHHGDLRSALVEAAFHISITRGRSAASLRAVTAAVGVSPTAAYRHFAGLDELRTAVGMVALGGLARAIEAAQREAATDPEAQLRAVGLGYIDFALDHPAEFGLAMDGLVSIEESGSSEAAGDSGRAAFQLLTDALARLVPEPPEGWVDTAAISCWSTVHGFAVLAAHGPFQRLPREQLDAMATDLVTGTVAAVVSGVEVRQTTPGRGWRSGWRRSPEPDGSQPSRPERRRRR